VNGREWDEQGEEGLEWSKGESGNLRKLEANETDFETKEMRLVNSQAFIYIQP
jgi:hypothetical protein